MYSKDNNKVFWEVVGEYSKQRREKCDSLYWVSIAVEQEDNFKDFISAVETIVRAGAKVKDFMDAQFQGADGLVFPEPKDLSTKLAVERWKLYMFNQTVEQHVAQQKIYANKLAVKGMTVSEMVASSVPFAEWFRWLYADFPVSQKIEDKAIEQLRNPKLYREVTRQGFDARKLVRTVKNV